jgi:hypothetical protein
MATILISVAAFLYETSVSSAGQDVDEESVLQSVVSVLYRFISPAIFVFVILILLWYIVVSIFR